MKRGFLILLIITILIFSSISLAQNETIDETEEFIEDINDEEFNIQKAYDWLLGKSTNGEYDTLINSAWAALALREGSRYDELDKTIAYLETQMNPTQYCFPSQNCYMVDTSLSVLALNAANKQENFDNFKTYFKDNVQVANIGNFLLQITTSQTGKCTFNYNTAAGTQEIDIEVDSSKFSECGNSNFLNLESCIEPNLLKNNPGLKLNIDCSGLEGNQIITLLLKSSNKYYIIDSVEQDTVEFYIDNGCFGRGPGDVCNVEASLFANWATRILNMQDLDVSLYLRENINPNNAKEIALLYLGNKDLQLLSDLKELQSMDGSFANDVITTSLAILALRDDPTTYGEEIGQAKYWLIERQANDGSINSAIQDTAITLYSVFGSEAIPPVQPIAKTGYCGDGICQEWEDPISCPEDCAPGTEQQCNYDGICDPWEDSETCPDDCPPKEDVCQVNNICEVEYGENIENCQEDCYCGDGVCDEIEQEHTQTGGIYACPQDCTPDEVTGSICGDGVCDPDEDEFSCPQDCASLIEEEKSSPVVFIIIILLLIAILGGGGYYAYQKGFLDKIFKPKPPAGGIRQQPYKPFGMPQRRPPMGPPRQQQPMRKPMPQRRSPNNGNRFKR